MPRRWDVNDLPSPGPQPFSFAIVLSLGPGKQLWQGLKYFHFCRLHQLLGTLLCVLWFSSLLAGHRPGVFLSFQRWQMGVSVT